MKERNEESQPKYRFSNIQGIETLNTGPLQSSYRACTDPLCCIIFLLILIYFLGVGCSALFLGDVNLIGAPYDPNHLACGVDDAALSYPYIYFVTPSIDSSGDYLYRTVCLQECPTNITTNVYSMQLKCLTNNVVNSCGFRSSPEDQSILFYNTVPYLGKLCLPEATNYYNMMENYMDAGWVTDVIVDIKHSYFMICFALLSTVFIGLFILKCLQWCDKVMITLLILIYFLSLLLFGVGFIYKGFTTEEINDSLLFQTSTDLINSASISSDGLLALILAGSILILLALSTSIYLCFHQDYFKFLTRIVKTTFEFLSDNNLLILFALCLYTILWAIVMGTVAVTLYIYSVGDIKENLITTKTFPFNQFQNTPFYYYNLFGLLVFMVWIAYFILGFYQFVLMGTASNWYFRDTHIDAECRRKGQKRLNEEISYSARNVIRTYIRLGLTKHFGSIALGSFMILSLGWLNTIVTFIKEKLEVTYKRTMNQKSCFNSFYRCFLWFFNNCMRYNTEIAYLMVAYKGDPFIISGIYTSYIIDEYYAIFSEISALTSLLSIGLNIVCSLIPSVIFYYVFEYISWYGLYLSSSIHPALVIAILAFINITIFNTVFSNIVDALIICYCIEKESLNYERKLSHFKKDPDYQQIPKEPALQNKPFLRILVELFNENNKNNDNIHSVENTQEIVKIPSEAQRDFQTKAKYKKTVIMKSDLIKQRPPPSTIHKFVEQYSLPKVNDIIRGSSPIKHVYLVEEKQPPSASKHRLGQQNSPFKGAPFSEVIRNSNENGFNFQKETFNINIDLKLEEKP